MSSTICYAFAPKAPSDHSGHNNLLNNQYHEWTHHSVFSLHQGKSIFRPRGRENNKWTLHSEYYAPEALSPNENNSVAMEQQIIPLPMFCQAKSMKTPGVHLKSQMFSPSYTERRMHQSLPNPYGWNKSWKLRNLRLKEKEMFTRRCNSYMIVLYSSQLK